MAKKRFNIHTSSKLFVGVVTVLLLVLGIVQIIQGQFDTALHSKRVHDFVAEATGQELTVKGKVSFSLLPTPTMYLPAVELRDAKKDSVPTLAADMLAISIAPMSLFSEPQISGVTIDSASLDLGRAKTGNLRWDWLKSGLAGTGGVSWSFSIREGRMFYRSDTAEETTRVESINVSGEMGAQPEMAGRFNLFGHDVRMDVRLGDAFVAKLTSGSDSVHFEGKADIASGDPKITGKLALDMEDMLLWLGKAGEGTPDISKAITNQFTKDTNAPLKLPLKFTGDWTQAGNAVRIANIQLQGLNSAGTGNIQSVWDDKPSIVAALDFSTWDYNRWRLLVDTLFLSESGEKQPGKEGYGQLSYALPEDISFSLHMATAKTIVNGQTWENSEMEAELDAGIITVNQFNMDLPGQTALTLFGVVSRGKTQGLRFEGSMETSGKSLRQMLTVIDPSARDLPDAGFGEFYMRSNIYLASDQLRLSEADAKINELQLGGGLVAYYDENPRLEADVKLKDINFDYFRDTWREKNKDASVVEDFMKYNNVDSFNWLRKLQTRIDFKVSVEGFTFLERAGDVASFRLYAKEGEFGIYNVHMYYPNDSLEANISLDVKGEKPALNVLFNVSDFDSAYFTRTSKKPDAAPMPEVPPVEKKTDVAPVPPAAKPAVKEKIPAKIAAPDVPKDSGGDGTLINIIQQAALVTQTQEVAAPAPASPPAAPTLPAAALATPGVKKWPETLIDTSWMNGLGGTFDISIGKLQFDGRTFDRFRIHATLKDNLLTFDGLSFYYWQGKCDISGSLYGGKVPGISIGYTIYNADVQEMMTSLFERDTVTGKVSVSGTLATSGLNYLSWLSQSEAKLVIAARGVNVQGFNLQGAVDAVNVSRTASDVLNNVNLALAKGSTEMSMDGNINIKDGVMRTPGITLKTEAITGNLTGEVRLVPWTLELSSYYQFPTMTSETVPTMTVQLIGPIDKPELQVDTSSLEAYVAKRIVGK